MQDHVVIIGVGQLGRIFAGGLLRRGRVVVPVNRGDNMALVARRWPEPASVLLAVAEDDLHPALAALPAPWRSRLALLQNELLPRDWTRHDIVAPTVISVWFEKKKGMDAKALLPSPAFGPAAGLLVEALAAVDLPARQVADPDALLWELVRKNVYILTSNLCGLVTGGDVGTLWRDRRELAGSVANEVLDIQDHLVGRTLARDELMQGLAEAIAADPGHACAGRSAPARLQRALGHAAAAGLDVPTLRGIARERGIETPT